MVTTDPTKNKADKQPITFVVPGQGQAAGASRGAAAARPAGLPGQVKASVRVGAQRGGGEPVRVTAVPGEDVVALHIAGGPVLLLHPATARDLMLAQGNTTRGGAKAAADADVAVPAQLRWRGLEQAAPTRGAGFLGDVLLSAFEVLTGFLKDPAADFVASEVVRRVDGQVEAGVYTLAPQALSALKGSGHRLSAVPSASEPMLVLVHGTFVDTVSTFGKLWALYPERVRALFDHYGGRVYALDHPTLGASPLANALTLVQALPSGARLHLATHSRGGLVAEVLARVAGQRDIGSADLAFFSGNTYATQRQELQALAAAVRAKDIRVERIVRVACPARGTLLASKRLDAYLSVLKWTLELAGVPIAPAMLDFVAEVARRRADPAQLPGLAAMMPDTPLVNWLNAAPVAIAGDLRVVAGDLQGDSVGSWLKTLLADAYYWTDNDVVVQTRSMYGGAPRQAGASFMLDQGGKVTHFNYFANERTVAAVVDGLTQAQPAGFRPIGPLSWAGQDSGGQRAAQRSADDGSRPAVFVLPGILGSNLKEGGQRIWLSLRLIGGLERLAYRAGSNDNVQPDGPIGLVYNDLIEHLGATHEVLPFGYDWRRPIEEEARRLADAVEAALALREASGQPVRLLAHSMGGVLARTMQLERPATWQHMMARSGARLLMLGTPNGGSWAPMQALSGDDTFGNALVAFGSPLANQRARQLIASMPGFLQLQAGLLDTQLGLDRAETWQRLADEDLARMQEVNWWHGNAGEVQEPVYRWGVPPQAVLDAAKALRLRLDAQRQSALPTFAEQLLLVVGHAKFTPDGFEVGSQGFVYLDAADGGDGRVALDSALLPGVRTWTLACEHGSLPSEKGAFEAFVELLQHGQTTKLAPLAATRSAAPAPASAHVRSRPSRQRPNARPAESESSVFDVGNGQAAQAEAGPGGDGGNGGAALRVAVQNGNLSFIGQALLVGHYQSTLLTGSERVVDRMVGGAMSASLAAGLYPEALGTQQVFVNTWRDQLNPWRAPRPQSVIVVGLAEEGRLREADIVASVRQGTIAWAQRVAEDPQRGAAVIELAATLLGSGGMGISASAAARAIARGVREANLRLAASGWPVVGQLTLIELYLDRASDAWQGLHVLACASPEAFELTPTIQPGLGPLRRHIDGGYRGADYDFISVTSGAGSVAGADGIAFALDTRRARTEVRAQRTQGQLVRELVRRAAQAASDDPQIGRTLFQLLVPVELEPFLGGTDRVVLELDDGTAPIPWELLDTSPVQAGSGDRRPWAVRTQLLRRLRKTSFRTVARDASADDAVLVIGEPQVDDPSYPPLPGARAEGQAVLAQLTGAGGLSAERVTALLDGADATTVISALLARQYRIVHIAGHGEPATIDQPGGVVLSGGLFLGPRELQSLRTVPELVFVNCCHLAAYQGGQTLRSFDPTAFAAGVADQLIAIGVRCVVAAGWAVDDGPAATFATTFYRELLAGLPFIEAVATAREAAWAEDTSGKTWAAYQCYGDPDWTYRTETGDAQAARRPLRDEFDAIASPVTLALALEEMAVRSRWMGAATETQQEKLRHLEARFGELWGAIGAVAEAFGVAWAECGEREPAIAWYERALQCNDASASMKVQEQLLNLRARQAWAQVAVAQQGGALATGRAQIRAALADLQVLTERHPTMERLSLLGSAWKRLAMVERQARDSAAQHAALASAIDAYRRAEELAARSNPAELFYPALNRMAIELVHRQGQADWPGFERDSTLAVRASLGAKLRSDPDFWSHVAVTEIELYEAVAVRRVAERQRPLQEAYAEVYSRVQASPYWASVADQARFVLDPYIENGDATERRAAAELLMQLVRYAEPGQGEDELMRRLPAAARERAGLAQGRLPDGRQLRRAARPEGQGYKVVIWHAQGDESLAAPVAAALQSRGVSVWTSAQTPARANRQWHLRLALEKARLGVVVVGPGVEPDDDATLEDWSALQESAWRTEPSVRLATLVAPGGKVPDFLLDMPRLAVPGPRHTAEQLAARLLALLVPRPAAKKTPARRARKP